MCGRFVQASSPELLAERFGVGEIDVDGGREPDYNVTPRAWVPVVRERRPKANASCAGILRRSEPGPSGPARSAESGKRDDPPTRVLSLLRWGLVPSWAKSPAIGDKQINARAESIAERPAYKRAFLRRRCIVPADAFYEWKPVTDAPSSGRRPPKVPYAVRRRDGEPLAFAGLWEIWRDPAVAADDDPDAWLRTCAIVTTRANDLLAPIHDRMPVVLPEAAWDRWLDPKNEDLTTLEGLLVPAPDEWFEAYEVSTRVSKPENNDADLLQRVA
jgi:putative SOS response-associated peptidase YedK